MGMSDIVTDYEQRMWMWLTIVVTLVLGVGSVVLILLGLPDLYFLLVIAILNFALCGLTFLFVFLDHRTASQ